MFVSEKWNYDIFSLTNSLICKTHGLYLHFKRAILTGSEDSKSFLVFISSIITRFFRALSKNLLNISARIESSEITSSLFARLNLEYKSLYLIKNFQKLLLSLRFVKFILL